jgi:uncharacterized protein (TIGR02996 family)
MEVQMSGDEGFLQAIIDDPDDDTVRLIYADWLDDHGNHARAEFIRVQIDLAQMKEDDDRRYALETRQVQLLAEHENEWLEPIGEAIDDWTFRRGFLDHAHLTVDFILREASKSFRHIPIRSASLEGAVEREAELASCAFLDRLRELALWEDLIQLPTLLASPHLAKLTALILGEQSFQSTLLEFLESPAHLDNLRDLYLYMCSLGHSAMAAIGSSTRRATLRRLEIYDCDLTTVGVEALADAGDWPELRTLRIERNDIGETAIRALCRMLGGNVTSLDLSDTSIRNAGVEQLARAPAISSLRRLKLQQNRLAGSAVRALSESPHLAHLEQLDLTGNQIGENGARALSNSKNLTHLEILTLRGNEIGDGGAEALGACDGLKALRRLELSANGLRITGVKGLIKTGKLANLRQLDLSSNLLGDMGLQVLARSPHLGQLRTLNLSSNKIGTTGIKDLAAFRNLTSLRELYLGGNEIDDEAARILLDSPLCAQLTVLDLRDTDITPAILPAVEKLAASSALRDVRLLSHELREEHLAPVKALLMHR